MTMTISDLPMDLLTEIVSRLPLRSMKKVRLTCKNWDTLTKSESFRKMHMSKEATRGPGESRMVALMDYKIHLISVFVDDVDHPYTESKGCLNLDDSNQSEQVKIVQVFHCEGLLLCVLKDTYRLVVWNPYLCQIRWIEPPSYSYRWPRNRYKYALGYDHNKKSHKILRFVDDGLLEPEDQYLSYEIYDFDSNLWRTLNIVNPYWSIMRWKLGLPLKGNTYWLNYDHCLVSFDFTKERFGPLLPLPRPEEKDRQVYVELSCLKEEKLTVLLEFGQPSEFEIWVTTTIDPNNVSWSKFLKVDTGSIVADRLYDLVFSTADFKCSCYVPSLVQIKKPLRVYKRKQRSKFDIRPCEQNKSRLEKKGRT